MSEKINNNQSKDDSVAKAWTDAVSTFTERTGLELPDDSPEPESDSVKEDDWIDDWDDDWDEESDSGDWSIDTPSKSRLDKYQYGWGDDPTPAQLEFERVKDLRRKAEQKNNQSIREIAKRREERERISSEALDLYRATGRYSDEDIETIERYLDEYANDRSGSMDINRFFTGIVDASKDNNGTTYDTSTIYNDPELTFSLFDYQKHLESQEKEHPDEIHALQNKLSIYETMHGIDTDRLKAFHANVEPLVMEHDDEVSSLLVNTNNDSVVKDRFGASDYAIHCLVQKITPSNVNELLMGRRELPTTNQYRLEQNRIDALELQGTLYRARDFIHDESPGVHELLSAMLEYYESKDDAELHATKEKALKDLINERDRNKQYYNVGSDDLASYVFDLENYEKPVHPRRLEGDSSSIGGDILEETEPAIDCLRRLVENTNPDRITPPETKFPELNELMQKLRITQNEQTGETHVDWRQAGELVGAVNQMLIDNQEKHGLYPSTVEAVAFAERIATFALRDITSRDWHELPYDPNFKELVRFSQLTYSDKPYDARKFERFWDGFQDIPNGDLSDENLQIAYGKLQRRILSNLSGLASKYDKNPYTSERTKALWSGNLIHELIGLADPNASRR